MSPEGITKEMVEVSVQKNFDKIDGTRIVQLLDAVKMVADTEESLRDFLLKMYQIANSLSKEISPHTPCGKGCHHCCHMGTVVSEPEAILIGNYIGLPPQPVFTSNNLEVLDKHLRGNVKKYLRVDCSFLKDGVCTIYSVRPLACRLNFNISDYPELCNLGNGKSDVPNVDLRAFWMFLFARLYSQASMADLRDYFPKPYVAEYVAKTEIKP